MDADALLLAAERRWSDLQTARPDLGPAIDLQRRLVSRSVLLQTLIAAAPALPLTVTPEAAAMKLRQHRPVLADETIEIDATPIRPFLLGFCEDFVAGGAGGPAERLRDTLEREAIDTASLLAASLGRRQEAVRTKAGHLGVSHDLLWLVAELAAGPIAHRLQHELLPDVDGGDPALAEALRKWPDGYCPACGSWPAFLETTAGARSAACSFCGRRWSPPGPGCIYCDASGDDLMTAAPDLNEPTRRVELCRRCGGYVKLISVDVPTRFALLPLVDLATSDLDAGASERGYGRPAMRDLALT